MGFPDWMRVLNPNIGELVEISELFSQRTSIAVGLTEEYKLNTCNLKITPHGLEKIVRITMRSGRIIDLAKNTSLLNVNDWCEVDKVRIGDYLAVPRVLPYFGEIELVKHKLILLAYMIGDGNCTSATLRFSNATDKIVEEFKSVVNMFGDAKVIQYECNQDIDYNIVNGDNFPKTRYKNGVRVLLEETDLFGKNALKKTIPEFLFTLRRENIALFLSRLFSTDGWASSVYEIYDETKKNRHKRNYNAHIEIGYSSSSERLARDLHHLLLRFGILSVLREKWVKYKDGRKLNYVVSIHGSSSVYKFLEIGIFGKEACLNKAVDVANKMRCFEDRIPKEIMLEVEELRIENGIRPKDMIKNREPNDRYRRQYSPQRNLVEFWGHLLGCQRLINLGKSDLYWDKVQKIEELGVFKTYNLKTNNKYGCVVNDFIIKET
ncbi:LAGLIDADG family homing endonuclease [Aneurinibacillus sp. Ricciae_BoGa-3]|uniref:LAGLIDADG family homing endonuclease n=1 Tax=Aneurinibacillus sp. Ricciae_BoGa-3 TaxID=3022697 RepID=UPI00233FFB2A|nr:LAGLIDADG family homing endonuclease [Aneurinibacillus sp. Ricciae_BoGa-3]WCK54755.1 LAGLIDADG family homing endonuclease [Aneurinibacillus sp. Ricciae_BoGa-3]